MPRITKKSPPKTKSRQASRWPWFIVVGRSIGDDEASANYYQARDRQDAMDQFIAEQRGDASFEVFIDFVFTTGLTKPQHA